MHVFSLFAFHCQVVCNMCRINIVGILDYGIRSYDSVPKNVIVPGVCLWSQKGGKMFLSTLTSDKVSNELLAGLEIKGELRWDSGYQISMSRFATLVYCCHVMPGCSRERSSAVLLWLN